MAILLLIVKIIGITLLAILGLILFLILMALFYPVGYRIRGEWQEDLRVQVTVGWLLSVVHVGAFYKNGETKAVVRLFGIPLMRIPKRKKVRKPKRTKKPKKVKPTKEAKETEQSQQTKALPAAKVTAVVPVEPAVPQDEPQAIPQEGPQKKLLPEASDLEYNREKQPKKTGFTEKLKRFITRLRGIGTRIKGIREQLHSVKAQIHRMLKMIRDEGNIRVVKLVWKELVGLLKRYRPRRVKADVNYSMGDPARTGQVLGGLAMLPFLYTQKVSVVPDFESEEFYVKGSWDIKGHIQVFPLIRAGLRIYKNQDVKKLIKQLREREED